MKKLYFLCLCGLLAMTSCSKTFYQVYKVNAEDMDVSDEAIKFENADCSVFYNLWADGGNMSFLFTNKTDHSLYLDMSESFYIKNGDAKDYYKEGSETYTTTYSVSEAVAASATLFGQVYTGGRWYDASVSGQAAVKKDAAASKSVTNINPKIICIPPYSSKYITSL